MKNYRDFINSPKSNIIEDQKSELAARKEMEARYGQVWNTSELQKDFTVHGFQAPYVVVTNKTTGKKGSLQFAHSPRFYFKFVED